MNGTAPVSNLCYSLISRRRLLIVLDSRFKSPNVAKNTLRSYWSPSPSYSIPRYYATSTVN